MPACNGPRGCARASSSGPSPANSCPRIWTTNRRRYCWNASAPSRMARDGADLEIHYPRILETLCYQPGTLGVIFGKAQSRIQEPAMLTRLVKELIDSENWHGLNADVKGDACESLLERNAQDVKTGACQYFTPRPLIQAIVDVMRPGPDTTICDPACGTGGFLLPPTSTSTGTTRP